MHYKKREMHLQKEEYCNKNKLGVFFLSFLVLLAEFLDEGKAAESVSKEKGNLQYKSSVFEDIYQEGDFPLDRDDDKQRRTPSYKPPQDHSQVALFAYKKAESMRINATMSDGLSCQVDSEIRPREQAALATHDRRRRILDPSEWPHSMHGHLSTTFKKKPNQPPPTFLGSGVLVGPNHVLTAGHNLYKKERGGWAEDVIFVPGCNENYYPFGDAKGCLLLCTKEWVEKGKSEYDFGMVILDEPLGYFAGWSGLLCASNTFLQGYSVSVTGYPGDKGDGDYVSTQMWTMENEIKRVEDERLFYDIDTHQGQSGSSIWGYGQGDKSYYTVGIHIQGLPGRDENMGVRLSSCKFELILTWLKKYQLVPSTLSNPLQLYKSYEKRAEKKEAHAQYQLGRLYYYGDGKEIKPEVAKAFEYFKKATEKYHVGALCALGRCYEEGQGVEKKDPQKAFKLYQNANDRYRKQHNSRDSAEATCSIGLCYLKGIGIDKDEEKATSSLKVAAKQGERKALYYLGVCYEEGQGVGKNIEMAEKCYNDAADRGHCEAIFKLAILYAERRQYDDAVMRLKQAARKGHIRAMCYLSKMYAKDRAALSKDTQTIEWLKVAAKQGDAFAQYSLGKVFEESAHKDETEADNWYKLAADQGYPDAQYKIAILYAEGRNGVKQDDNESVNLLKQAARKGHKDAMRYLSKMYVQHRANLLNEDQEAMEWLKEAANDGDEFASFKLAKICESAHKDVEAVSWYKRAAKRGYADAKFELGKIYENGLGIVKKDEAKLEKWYRRAADHGYVVARFKLAKICESAHRYDDAIYWYKLAAEQDYADAQFKLGEMYEKGQGIVEKNEAEAEKWYRMAADHEYVVARFKLAKICESAHRYDDAIYWYKLAAEQDYLGAKVRLEEMYEKGLWNVKKDEAKAEKWYRLGADHG